MERGIRERHEEVGGLEILWREAPPATPAPVLYLHGVPTDGEDWLPFLERTGGYAPDLPGFGRSDKPAHFDYSTAGYAKLLEAFLERVELSRFSLVMHDWGVVGLALAVGVPERVDRLVVIDGVPLLPGYRWHRFARIWRTPLGGELFMGMTTKWSLKRLSRAWLEAQGPAPKELIDRIWRNFDHGTQRAILKLYRSAPPAALAAAGDGLDRIGSPALVVWGSGDPFIPVEFAHAYGERLGAATVEVLDGARHWPWLDRPELIDRVARFLTGEQG